MRYQSLKLTCAYLEKKRFFTTERKKGEKRTSKQQKATETFPFTLSSMECLGATVRSPAEACCGGSSKLIFKGNLISSSGSACHRPPTQSRQLELNVHQEPRLSFYPHSPVGDLCPPGHQVLLMD